MMIEPFETFVRRVEETARWCSSRAGTNDLARALRSAEIAPPDREAWPERVAAVATRRAELLPPGATQSPEGRLLLFDPGQSLSDGAAEMETAGFFDVNNTPPWDTWVAYIEEQSQRPDAWTAFDSYLVCWIPAQLAGLVSRGISVNPEVCLRWADTSDAPFLRQWFSHR
jgi:hypothetical protein